MSFSESFFKKNPIRNNASNVTKPEKPTPPPPPPMSESEKKLMKQTMSVTDKSIREQEYPGKVGVIIGEGAPKMSPLDATAVGGYEGAADTVGGAKYYPTSSMYTEMFSKLGKDVAEAIDGPKPQKADEAVAGDVEMYTHTDGTQVPMGSIEHFQLESEGGSKRPTKWLAWKQGQESGEDPAPVVENEPPKNEDNTSTNLSQDPRNNPDSKINTDAVENLTTSIRGGINTKLFE
tara:strand:- start:180 stop:881 length:702 start_codon:yes stop_codon:yes gene_type:complete